MILGLVVFFSTLLMLLVWFKERQLFLFKFGQHIYAEVVPTHSMF